MLGRNGSQKTRRKHVRYLPVILRNREFRVLHCLLTSELIFTSAKPDNFISKKIRSKTDCVLVEETVDPLFQPQRLIINVYPFPLHY
jgi:hypothetical protein